MNAIQKRAEQASIALSYDDVWGKPHDVSEETLRMLTEAVENVSADEPGITQTHVLAAGKRARIETPTVERFELRDEEGKPIEQGGMTEGVILLPPLKTGYYRLRLIGRMHEERLLIVAPPRCWMPEAMEKGLRVWGLSAQLYGLRSEKNWGIGDFGDLRTLVKGAASFGMDVVGLNPLHAFFEAKPQHFSPYSPSNRLYLNQLYINVTGVEGFAVCEEAQRLWKENEFQEKLRHAREADKVDYPLVAALKEPILRALYRHFSEQGENDRFLRFREAGGKPLFLQAVFDALCGHFRQEHGAFQPWRQWPLPYQNPGSKEVQSFAESHPGEVEYHLWLQWVADCQLEMAQQMAVSRGMQVGLYRDLAVGSDKAGAEIWMEPEAFISGFSIGAPPDEYNPNGQNWGLPALHPWLLKKRGYETFIRLLRANMRHCRALRIDHAFGLSRLFLIPDGMGAAQGSYLHYPFKEMLAVIRVESHRQQCMVIGEDLGTFPPDYKEAAAASGLFSYKLLYFERDAEGYTPPHYYPKRSLAVLSTHDLPTLRGWLASADIDEREKLDLYPSHQLITCDRENRQKDKELLAVALGEVNGEQGKNGIAFEQVQRYLGKSPAAIVMAQLEDVLGVLTQVNLPGTTEERPNWQAKLPRTLKQLLEKNGPLAPLASAMNEERARPLADIPRATYRLQFHKDFTFHDAVRILPYLASLGISHVYASPYLKARPGSMHGYDITDHCTINPELGGAAGYEAFLEGLSDNNLKQILDFVPNHMAVGGNDNAWWTSVLEWGQGSPFAPYFDIDWTPRLPGETPKLIVPFLGDHYGDILDRGELKLVFDSETSGFFVRYAETLFPICPKDYPDISEKLEGGTNAQAGEALKEKIRSDQMLHTNLKEKVGAINGDKDRLHALLERQHYRLAYWRTAASDINYRRFFDITHLAGMRVEEPELFEAMHAYVLTLIRQGKLHGLRIDHIDGLADPAGYLGKLREKAGGKTYITVEKILGAHEALPTEWNIQGTSGYDALNLIGNLFVDGRKEKAFDRIYRRFVAREHSLGEEAYHAKLQIMETSLASELQALSLLLKRIMSAHRHTRDYPLDTLRQALKEIIGWFPVYRTYITRAECSDTDVKIIEWAVGLASKHSRLADRSVYDAIASLLLLEKTPIDGKIELFVRKFQQLSGPVMAKGVEDTVFYRYSRLVSLNEVGNDPGRFGLSVKAFHETHRRRVEQWPHSMLATATHDTKRGEDMRMRLHALSEMPEEWERTLRDWSPLNRTRRTMLDGKAAPSREEEYFIYQTLLGSWPCELMQLPFDKEICSSYKARLDEYLVKALREAKLHTDWGQPDEAYESAVLRFKNALLDEDNLFLEKFLPLVRRMAMAGAVNGLSQTVLKCTLPGVPDIYQGNEYWDFSLVDPDNRRPVDYAVCQQTLDAPAPLAELLDHWQNGRIKQFVVATLLKHRKAHEDLYRSGSYVPLKLKGKRARNALAYLREYEGRRLIVIVPLRISFILKGTLMPDSEFWEDTCVMMPGPGTCRNLFTGKIENSGNMRLSHCLEGFPCAVLMTN